MVVIKNEYITAKFKEIGAELKSLTCDGIEYIWPGDKKIWAYSAPLLFPICSGLIDNEYCFNGKMYHLQKHGYARFCKFKVEALQEERVTFLLTSDKESKKCYPFDYELRVTYLLEEKKLKVKYNISNYSKERMYFSIGAHEAYYCPEGIEEYDVILPEQETLDSIESVGDLVGKRKERILENGNTLALKYDYFKVDALLFKDIKAKSVILKNRNNGRAVKLIFEGSNYFLIWTINGAPYICLEPWCGIADSIDSSKELKKKETLISIESGDEFATEHIIEIL